MALTPGQQACVETLAAPVAVSAGAGSGKTYTLTQRIVHAIETGAARGIDEVLAITFTAKAAGEIKSRVKSALAAAGRVDDARAVDDAWVSTIHGMCARILREHAIELGIDPAFSIVEGEAADRLRDAAIDEALRSANDMISPAGLDALFGEYPARSTGPYGGGSVENMLKTLIDAASTQLSGLDAVNTLPAPQSGMKLLARVADCARALAALAEAEKESGSRTKYLAATESALEGADAALAEGVDDKRALRLIAAFPYPAKNFGSKTGAYQMHVGEARELFDECMNEARLAAVYPLLGDLVALARTADAQYRRRKHDISALDNNDLLVMAARALDERPEIARSYVGRFSVIMIDEFQDTDQMQVDMIKRIAGDGWQRLCTVGDAQQSIYRFRGADVSVFRRHVREVGHRNPSGMIALPDNFRSHADVLAFVDRVFEQPNAFGASFMSLAPARDEARVSVPFRGFGPRIDVVDIAYAGIGTDDACRFEADVIAQRFAALREAGHSAGDMVVLLGTMSRAGVYAEALRRLGMACVVQKGSVFNRMPEVRVMVRLAQVIANPAYTAALFEVLSSGMFELSADDFVELSTYYDEVRGVERRQNLAQGARRLARTVEESPSTVSPRLREALSLLVRMRAQVGRRPVARIMADAVRDSGWLSRLERSGAEGQAVAGNVLKAIRMVEDIESQGGVGPLAIARRLERMVDVAHEAPGALSTEGGDFVRIMTVHASKGLEFPVVAVAEMAEKKKRASRLLCRASGGQVFASLDAGYSLDAGRVSSTLSNASNARPFDGLDEDELEQAFSRAETASAARAAMRALDEAGDTAERKRLMYVAITRAKEAVVLAMRGCATKAAPSGIDPAKPSTYAIIQSALAGPGACFEPGVTMVDFGGSRPARVERIDLDEERFAQFEGSIVAEAAAISDARDALDIDGARVPVYEPVPQGGFSEEPAAPMRERVFSYSSISADRGSEGERGFGLLCSSVDEGAFAESGFACADAVRDGAEAREDDDARMRRSALSFDDEAWEAIRADLSDADKATDLGTAFHRLAQCAVIARPPDGARLLARPSAARVKALCRACRVTPRRRMRLEAALDRWFESSLAARVACWERVEAEVPFFVRVDVGGAPAYLEGEIDLLATGAPIGDPAAGHARPALVVDYKTGGFPDEDPDKLREKHALQATCYAYAVLLQGYDAVELVFVRVEQDAHGACGEQDALIESAAAGDLHAASLSPAHQKGSGDTPEPQCVSYAFTAADLPALEAEISRRAKGRI